MKTNFEIEENYAVQFKNRHIDLHNNFDFIELADNAEKNEITLKFTKTKGEWVQEGEFSRLIFLLKNVNYRYFEEGDDSEFPEDAKRLGEITFFPSNLREVNDSFTLQKNPEENDDLMFLFENGRVVRVNCEEAELIVEE
ncbi:hypothetical protein ACFSC6_06295 [Rufibacter sediminis]|uniref:Beta-lactamase-inhibitor-like PepSY-like domain-containing protein n=1 Tax=Rufibacter sediminis TaxID=2762756 RepID=A0ABR6VNF1_9BACT|nr:hypothetical protein [Rufibacter sediminis]MBC3538613.1 hypothetical protein [Rufibacter sediminis]